MMMMVKMMMMMVMMMMMMMMMMSHVQSDSWQLFGKRKYFPQFTLEHPNGYAAADDDDDHHYYDDHDDYDDEDYTFWCDKNSRGVKILL